MEIDVVFSGGGIRGLAFLGAYQVLEEKCFTFKRIAATSAGSIIAGLIRAGYTSEEIIQLVDELNFKKLLDQRSSWIPSKIARWLFLYKRMGLYKGDALEKWIAEKLKAKGIVTFRDLPEDSLQIVASDLSNNEILVLPNDLPRYDISPLDFPVAKAIRMSCSLPYFFEPVKLKSPQGVSVVVDGGVLSNFPIWLFVDKELNRNRPVIGISVASKEKGAQKQKIKNAIQLFESLFQTMKNAHDSRYISRKIEKDIMFLPIDEEMTTDFALTDEKRDAIIEAGRLQAYTFFKKWAF